MAQHDQSGFRQTVRIGRRRLSRRAFLGTAAAACTPWIIPSSALGADGFVAPSERIGAGLIGCGAMGSGHLGRLASDAGVQLIAMCDVDGVRRELGKQRVEQRYAARDANGARTLALYNDYRELLGRPDIDAVVIATTDHWHALQSIDAARAGKDVYCEKPVSMTVEEGRRIVEVVRRYGRIFQTGTQYRSIPTIRQVCAFIRSGGLGKIKSVFTNVDCLISFLSAPRYRPYNSVLNLEKTGGSFVALDFPLPAEPVPEGLDWDLWLGPAPWRPYSAAYHVNPSPGVVPWSFCEDFGVTSLTWNLAHAADVIQYVLGVENSGPVEIHHPSSGPYPTLTCRYSNGAHLHFVRNWQMVKDLYKAVPEDARLAGNFGGVFVGERGWLTTMSTGGQIEGGPGTLVDEIGLKTREVVIGHNDHHANWLECIRTRKQPSTDEEIGHRSASLGHVMFAAYRLGRSLTWDPAKEEFVGDEDANRLRARSPRSPWRI